MKKTLLLIMFMLPLGARADFVVYDFTGEASDGWTVSGEVVMDAIDAVSATNLVDNFISWSFGWTNGSSRYSASSENSTFLYSEFYVDVDGQVAWSDFCTSTCQGGDMAAFYVVGDRESQWIAGLPASAGSVTPLGRGRWSGPQVFAPQVSEVPEPGALMLLGIGLAGIAATRRRRPA